MSISAEPSRNLYSIDFDALRDPIVKETSADDLKGVCLAWLAGEKRGAIFAQRNTFDIDAVEASQACAIQDLVRMPILS